MQVIGAVLSQCVGELRAEASLAQAAGAPQDDRLEVGARNRMLPNGSHCLFCDARARFLTPAGRCGAPACDRPALAAAAVEEGASVQFRALDQFGGRSRGP
jgi:hypothetical protein